MKKSMKAIIGKAMILSLVLMSALVFSSVNSYAAAKKPTKITVTPTKKTLTVGNQTKIKVKSVKPAKASKAVTFKSSNKKVATVTSKGVVKARKAGKTVITVTSKKAKKVKAKVTITVKAKKTSTNQQTSAAQKPDTSTDVSSKKSIVIYFSRGENTVDASEYAKTLETVDAITSASIVTTEEGKTTGNVGILADWIADALGTTTYSIHVTDLYPQNKKETQAIVNNEQLDGVFPAIEKCNVDFSEYDVVYLGFPNWYGEPPRALYTFLNENDLDGKTIIPFTSDDKNGFSDAIEILKSKLPNSVVLEEEDGLVVKRKNVFDSKSITLEWVAEVSKKAETAQANPLATAAGQKEAAQKLIGQTLTKEQIVEAVGQYYKYAAGTNGCTKEVESGRFFYPGFVIYSRASESGTLFTIYSID